MKPCLLATLLSAFATAPTQTLPSSTPDATEQKEVLGDAREHALNLERSLPDFICIQTTRRFERVNGRAWQPIDVIVERLTYFDHRELYKVLTMNGQPSRISHQQLGGASSTGEFGSLTKEIFAPETETEFEWKDSLTLRGRMMQVYAYKVRAFRSKYHIELPDRSLDLVTAYRGLVFIAAENHLIYRITLHFDGIPQTFPVQDLEISLDYDHTRIGEVDYLVPFQFELSSRRGNSLIKNHVEFGNYQKFDAVSLVRFDSGDGRE
jgi:hypothetical protein